LPDDLKPLFRAAYITGWRVKAELSTRQWPHVDFVNGKLRLDPGEDKNKSGHAFPFTPELKRLRVVDQQTGQGLPHVRLTSDNGIVCYTRADGSVLWTESALMGRDVWFSIEGPRGQSTTKVRVAPGGHAEVVSLGR
jgi:hypothetical protein